MNKTSALPFKTFLSVILFIISCTAFAQTTYYVSSSTGSDDNSGTKESSAWQNIEKINNTPFSSGDSILFKRGDKWRYPLFTMVNNAAPHLYFGAYGEGKLPLLLVSKNMNTTNHWWNLGENIWVCNHKFTTDVGNIIFDNEESVGYKKMTLDSVNSQNDFYYNLMNDSLYIYSTDNPATVHNIIECALRYNVIDVSHSNYITIENLALKYSAAHGIGGTECSHITIRNCEISWIGGGDLNLDGNRRYGNGIEFWANASDCLVDGNKIWEIYDTGVTNQSYPVCVQKNIIYRNNIIWNCGLAALEIWNADTNSISHNIRFENNTCFNMGKGWGAQRPDPLGVFFAEFPNEASNDSIFIRNNIFMNPLRFFYAYQNTEKFNNIHLDYNCYYPQNANDTFKINYTLIEVALVDDFDIHQNHQDKNSFFSNPIFIDEENNDFHLDNNSPCIDAGLSIDNPMDHDKTNRPQNNAIDMGAYENIAINISHRKSIDFVISPNPTHNSTTIYTINAEHAFKIKIYNTFGQIIYSNFCTKQQIESPLLESGIYIIELELKDYKKSKKLIVQ